MVVVVVEERWLRLLLSLADPEDETTHALTLPDVVSRANTFLHENSEARGCSATKGLGRRAGGKFLKSRTKSRKD